MILTLRPYQNALIGPQRQDHRSGGQGGVADPFLEFGLAGGVALERAGGAEAVLRIALVVEAAGAPDRPGAARVAVAEREEAGPGAGDGAGLDERVAQLPGQGPGGLGVVAEEAGRVQHVEV